jgi:hypothetical protein
MRKWTFYRLADVRDLRRGYVYDPSNYWDWIPVRLFNFICRKEG